MDEKTLLIQALTKWFNKSEDEVTKMIYDTEGKVSESAFENISTMDAARVSKFSSEKETHFKNGEAKATERVNKQAAKLIKESLGIDTDSDVLTEVLDEAKNQIEAKTKKKVEPLTDEAVKQHPLYIKLEKERVPKTEYEKVVAEFENHKATIEQEKVFSMIDEQALLKLKAMNPDFDRYKDSPQVLNTLQTAFKTALREYSYKPDGNGGFIVLNKAGERVNDEHGNPVTIDHVVKQKAPDYFTFLKQPPKGSAGNDPNGALPSGTTDFKTKTEYNAAMKSLMADNTPEGIKKRNELMQKYQETIRAGGLPD